MLLGFDVQIRRHKVKFFFSFWWIRNKVVISSLIILIFECCFAYLSCLIMLSMWGFIIWHAVIWFHWTKIFTIIEIKIDRDRFQFVRMIFLNLIYCGCKLYFFSGTFVIIWLSIGHCLVICRCSEVTSWVIHIQYKDFYVFLLWLLISAFQRLSNC